MGIVCTSHGKNGAASLAFGHRDTSNQSDSLGRKDSDADQLCSAGPYLAWVKVAAGKSIAIVEVPLEVLPHEMHLQAILSNRNPHIVIHSPPIIHKQEGKSFGRWYTSPTCQTVDNFCACLLVPELGILTSGIPQGRYGAHTPFLVEVPVSRSWSHNGCCSAAVLLL